jgi:hypothetical protein
MKDQAFKVAHGQKALQDFLLKTLRPEDVPTSLKLLRGYMSEVNELNLEQLIFLKWLADMTGTYKKRSETYLVLLKRVIEKSQGEIRAEVVELRNFIDEQMVPERKPEDYREEAKREIEEVGREFLKVLRRRLRM